MAKKDYPTLETLGNRWLQVVQNSMVSNWDLDALTDYDGATLKYRDVARKIEKIHIIFEKVGIVPGDKIAICGRNSSNWGVSFLAIQTYGAVSVPILNEFKADNVHNIVNHSEAKMLFVGDIVWENLSAEEMPNLLGIMLINDFSVLVSRNDALQDACDHLNELFGKKYPKNFRPEHINYYIEKPDDMAILNYTSGTTSASKGVMLPYRAIFSNLQFAVKAMGKNLVAGDKVISMLPMAHMYGMAFEFIYEISIGCHIYFLTRTPSPTLIFKAFNDVKPNLIVSVPLIIEKIIKKKVLPQLETPLMKLVLSIPGLNQQVLKKVCDTMTNSFGGNFYEIIMGGAGLNPDVDKLLHALKFHYTVGYGMTECAPIICYAPWDEFVTGSCGRPALNMEVKILSDDPQNIVGEIVCRGPNVMLGYYKNETATAQVLDADGWLHTGDLGIMDAAGNVFIKGRSKNMLLGANGQNVYPEEIEDKLNNLPFVAESIVVQRGDKLVALVYPDFDDAYKQGLSEEDLVNQMESNRVELNGMIAAYEKISQVEIFHEEFEKTPKKSIKRFLYK